MATPADFIAKCRRRLVDTSMRSRLLNYRSGARSGALEFVRQHPGAIWGRLVVDASTMTFGATAEDETGPVGAPGLFEGGGPGDPEQLVLPVPEAVPDPWADPTTPNAAGEQAAVHDRSSAVLETRLVAEALATRLRRLADTARMTQEEQGVDTLFLVLGFLHYFELDNSETLRRAPLLLVPARLERDGPDRWKVRARDDDPLVNPALTEYMREQHKLVLPQLSDSLEGFDPLEWFRQVQRLVAARPRWSVQPECAVGIFSFQKFVMHEDLKRNADVLAKHAVISALATHSGGGGGGTTQLPDEVAGLDLDREFAPESTVQVVDADSTQLRAIAAVQRGHHLVIEGPPGSGKSQTISNVIAGALGAGKTVLFVAEKQAALNVVFDRLRKAGLRDACFEVHSTKANKAAVLKELGRALDATLAPSAPAEPAPERLAAVRSELTEYVRAVHRRVEPLGRSVFSAVGRLSALQEAPAVRVALRVDGVPGADVQRAIEDLARLAAAAGRVGDPAAHPWRDMTRDFLDIDAREAVQDAVAGLARTLPALQRKISEAATAWGLPGGSRINDCVVLGEVADVLGASPGVEAFISTDARWRGPRPDVEALLGMGEALVVAEQRAREQLGSETVDPGLAAAAEVAQPLSRKWWRLFSGRWRAARAVLREHVPKDRWRGVANALDEVVAAREAMESRKRLHNDPNGAKWFGARWLGSDSSWTELRDVGAWLARFRATVEQAGLGGAANEAIARSSPDTSLLRELAAQATEALGHWQSLGAALGWQAGYWAEESIDRRQERVAALLVAPSGWQEWAEFSASKARVAAGVAAPLVGEAAAGRLTWSDLPRSFERRFLERWLDAQAVGCEALKRFVGASHEAKIVEFRELDQRVLRRHRAALVGQLRGLAQERLRAPGLESEQRFLRDQLARQRGHRPVRELLLRACGAVRAIKPCFLMSPMTVAQCLDPVKHKFDLVVFDEASQMPPEDALGAIVRAAQMVVVGDPKQLPPTNFFAVQSGQEDPEPSLDGSPTFQDLDSVLELALASGFPGARLRWHYRSRHESLIAYSNRNFYDSSLFTFPSADLDQSRMGLQFRLVSSGCYEGEGVNRAEARAVVDEVVAHSREHPTKSLCVGTFSLAQQLAVQDELELRRRMDPNLDEFLALDRPEPFFVKNLESIQGDERDTVFLSVTYGPGADGKIRHNFGPINGQNGWRRLNVLTTRARERMIVFSSLRADDIDLARAQSGGAALLRGFLRYAETGQLEGGPVVEAMAQAESPFEAQVLAALVREGVRVQPQVGVAGYRIDIGVIDPEVQGRFICGIECDGVAYHAAESARDRDRLREGVLQGLGWRLHRVWSLDWWHDRAGQVKRLLDLIARSGAEARRAGPLSTPGANASRESPAEPSERPGTRSDGPSEIVRGSPQPLVFEPYVATSVRRRGTSLLNASDRLIADVMLDVLRSDGPLHEEDLRDRAMRAFGKRREGTRITARLDRGMAELFAGGTASRLGEFWRCDGRPVRARQRTGLGVPAERISPWEYEVAVLQALVSNAALQEEEVVVLLRDAFGYGSASAQLRAGIQGAISRLAAAGRLGVGTAGVALLR